MILMATKPLDVPYYFPSPKGYPKVIYPDQTIEERNEYKFYKLEQIISI